MEYTKNYHLPQWAEEDRILMGDFNQAMASLENGITAAQNTADKLPYVVGQYTGNGGTQNIELGFRPQYLMVRRSTDFEISTTDKYSNKATVQLTDTGFTVVYSTAGLPVNISDIRYSYIAFR